MQLLCLFRSIPPGKRIQMEPPDHRPRSLRHCMRPEGGIDYRKFVAYETRISDEAASSTEPLMDRWNSPTPRPKRSRSSLGVNAFYEIATGNIVTVTSPSRAGAIYSCGQWLHGAQGSITPPMKMASTMAETRWSQWLEAMRKDTECTFGILEGR